MDLIHGESMQTKGLEPGWCSPGVYLLDRYGPFSCGGWIFFNGEDCALVEAPWEDGRSLATAKALEVTRRNGWVVRYILLSHTHLDHTRGLKAYREAFPHARLITHESFAHSFLGRQVNSFFKGGMHVLRLGGEPVVLLHAPKHSPEDTLFFFRGTCISGDWIWGAYPEGRNLVREDRIVRSLEDVARTLHREDYQVHTIFSSHANEARRECDFLGLLDEMHQFFKLRTQRSLARVG